ncbi:MAG: transporter substrate-binding domain-containing protein [Pseudomonas sp.]|uniref:substrate-binding periplasmic protein n=1 Tax=Pseudomonas sp. TaxID=306 RepID=UPI003981B772
MSIACALVHADEPTQVRIAAEVWPGFTNADGSGVSWDIFRMVYEPVGVKLQALSEPYTRSIGLVQRGEADAWVGSYRNEVKLGAVYPRWHYDFDQIVALGLSRTPVPTLENLGSFRLAWVRGYEYQQYLPNLRQYREVIRRSGILGMLDQGRADFYLDAVDEVADILDTASDPTQYRVTPVTKLNLYLGFTDSERGRALAELFDQRMDELVADGSLRPIFQRWQQPYPFD